MELFRCAQCGSMVSVYRTEDLRDKTCVGCGPTEWIHLRFIIPREGPVQPERELVIEEGW